MTDDRDLKEAEKRAWTLYFGDGLWDIFLGLMFIGGALRTLSGSLWAYLLILAGILALVIGRKMITLPRLGEIKFGPKRGQRRRVLILLLVAAVLLTLVAWFLFQSNSSTGLILALGAPLVLIYMAYLLDFGRLYGYAVLMALFMIVTELVSLRAGAWVELLVGLVILSVGFWYLNHFLATYPLPPSHDMENGAANGR